MAELEAAERARGRLQEVRGHPQAQRDLTKEIGEAAGKDDTAAIQKIGAKAQKAQDEYRRLTGKIGFKECGGGV